MASQTALALPGGVTLSSFTFGAHAVRVIMRDGEPWFVATDVAEALGYSSPKDAAEHLDADEKGSATTRTPGGDQRVTVINESGLYALVLRSRKPEARKFAKWVVGEVLPAIRKTGRYEQPGREKTLNEMVDFFVSQINTPNGAPAMLFLPLVEAVQRKLGKSAHEVERISLAFKLAAQAAAEVERTVFDAVMDGDNASWQHGRYLLSLAYDRDNKPTRPWVSVLRHTDMVVSPDELPRRLAGPDCIAASEEQLAAIATACTERLAHTAIHRAERIKALSAGGSRPVVQRA